ncbi:zinc-binding dehydrogenase [Streptomyces sp. RM99]|nr:zinc-binding dehydrogenase [Streptomyces sp. RM99]
MRSSTRHSELSVPDQVPRTVGVDHPVVDDGHLTEKIRALVPQGVDAALELVGCSVLVDTLRTVHRHGTVCCTGALAGQWSVPDFSPFMIPVGARLTGYAGQATDLPADVFARQLHAIAEGRLKVPVAKVYRGMEEVRDAHADVESGTILGKHVALWRTEKRNVRGHTPFTDQWWRCGPRRRPA